MKGNDYPESRAKPIVPEVPVDAFDAAIPEPPGHLDRRAKIIFREMAHELSVAGVLRSADRWVLGQCAQAMSDVIRLTREVRKEGSTYKGPQGGTVYNPKVGILRDRERELKAYCDRLGLSPRARAALEFPEGIVPTEGGSGEDAPEDQMEFWIEEERQEKRKRAAALAAQQADNDPAGDSDDATAEETGT